MTTSRATDHLERIGADERVEPSIHDAVIALGMVLDERLGQIRDASALVQPNPTPTSSVEIEQLARPGCPPRITVKCYAADVDEAAARATALYDQLVARYTTAKVSS